MKVYLCSNDENSFSEGTTLEEAHQNFCDEIDDIGVSDCVFYEAERLEVEVKIIRKEIPIKLPSPKGK